MTVLSAYQSRWQMECQLFVPVPLLISADLPRMQN